MSGKAIHPSTFAGIKRLANRVKKERGIKHMQALDEAAHAAGFENCRHARNELTKGQNK